MRSLAMMPGAVPSGLAGDATGGFDGLDSCGEAETMSSSNHPKGRIIMKIIVIGGTGLIGSKVVLDLLDKGHNAVAASPNSGVNTLTGEGHAAVLAGAAVLVDQSTC